MTKLDSRTGFYATTKRGDEAALALFRALGSENSALCYEARQIMSGIVRHAKKLIRIGEDLCNGPEERFGRSTYTWSEERYSKWQTQLEAADEKASKRISELMQLLADAVGVDANRLEWEDRSPYCVVIVATDERDVPREVVVA